MKTVIAFRPGELLPALLERGVEDARHLVARRDLERYYALLRDALASVRLEEAEALLLADVLNGTLVDAHSYRLLWAEVEDACRQDGADRRWGVDGLALAARLRAMAPCELMAIADAVERAWLRAEPDMRDRLRAVGLVRGQAGGREGEAS
jgi:hypothetical protein